MKSIRKSIFETNSSSTHVFCIDEGSDFTGMSVPKDGIKEITLGEYGWEHETYTDPQEKISYFVTYFVSLLDGAVLDSLKSKKQPLRLVSDMNYCNNANCEMMFNLISDHCDVKDILIDVSEDDGYYYIDHAGALDENKIFGDKDKLKSLLFGVNSVIITGNDNDGSPHCLENDECEECKLCCLSVK